MGNSRGKPCLSAIHENASKIIFPTILASSITPGLNLKPSSVVVVNLIHGIAGPDFYSFICFLWIYLLA
ncbi:MAG TPA: hypothetical protein VD815_01100 [Candidatus Saccharimonadales bacterium]|nr:hypothetical protein [Candidatus Saccharimonadales bacterium]